MSKIIFVILILTCSSLHASRTLYSIDDGNWNDPYIWITQDGLPSIPSPEDHIVISHEITHVIRDRDTYTQIGNVLIEEDGAYLVHIGQGNTKAYIFAGQLFEVFGTLVTSDDFSHQKGVPNGNGIFHAHSGANIFIGDDYEPHEQSRTINDVECFVMGDDLKFFGDESYVCGTGKMCIGPYTDIPGTANGEVRAIIDGRHVSGFDFICSDIAVYRIGEDSTFCAEYVRDGSGPEPFPVEMLSFEAEQIEGFVRISWATASELNNNFFTLERGIDAENFLPIRQIQGTGTTETVSNYEFIDRKPLNGKVYYRLKQTDFDGNFSYSGILEIDVQNTSVELHAYPSLQGEHELIIEAFGVDKHTALLVNIRDLLGKSLIQSKAITDCNGNFRHTLNVSSLSGGVFIVTCDDGVRRLTKKILIP